MKKIMSWLENSFAPTMNNFARNPWVAALSGSMMKVLPIILVGALIFFYNVFRSWIPSLPDFSGVLQFTFHLTSLVLTFLLGNQLMEKLDHPIYSLTGGIASVIVYLISCKPVFEDGSIIVTSNRFGPAGMFVAIVIALLVGLVYHLYAKLHVLENSTTVPDFVCEWINQLIPLFVVVLAATIISTNLDLDIYALISALFSPLEKLGFTLPGFIVIVFVQAFLYSMGISTWFVSAFTNPILLAGTANNIALAAAGQIPTYIVCYETIYLLRLVTLGGAGCTLPLNMMMMRSKSSRLKTLGGICIAPAIFNINEPIVFGTPIVFNPLLMIPMWLNAIVTSIITWVAMSLSWLEVPAASVTTGQIPAPFGYIMVTGDFRALIFWALTFVVTWFIWFPFFKVYERQVVAEEEAEAAEAAETAALEE